MKPILCRPGGKKLLVKRILKEIPEHKTYVEPMVGTGTVFFSKELAKKNVLGDNDKALVSFYKRLQRLNGLTCDLRRNKTKFQKAKTKKSKSSCDYAYVTKTSFGCAGKQYNDISRGGTNSIQTFDRQIRKLKKANITSDDFVKTIKKHDSKDTFFYIDPPYHEKSCSYPKGSCQVKPKDVAKAIKGIKGQFLLSYNNHPDVRKEFCDKYKCKRVKTRYTTNKLKYSSKQKRIELLIKNY